LSVSVAPVEGIEVGEPVLPAPHPFRVEGLEQQFFVYDRTVSLAVPAVFTKNVGDQALHLEVGSNRAVRTSASDRTASGWTCG
jgi:hypothetical protein